MKKNLLLQIILVLILGAVAGYYLYQNYQTSLTIGTANSVYFLQEGAYTSENGTETLNSPHITVKENNKYYTYLGMTLDKDVAKRIKDIYENYEIPLYIKEVPVNNQTFLMELSQYDILLKNATTYEEISNILDTILSTYQETVICE